MRLKLCHYGNNYKLISINFDVTITGWHTTDIKYLELYCGEVGINTRLTYRNLNFIFIFAR